MMMLIQGLWSEESHFSRSLRPAHKNSQGGEPMGFDFATVAEVVRPQTILRLSPGV
jgi:hypothetical protein